DVPRIRPYTPVEFAEVFLVECIGKAQHRRIMDDFAEARQNISAHPLRRRVRHDEVRVAFLKFDKLVDQSVILRVGHERSVEDIVGMAIFVEELMKLLHALFKLKLIFHNGSLRNDDIRNRSDAKWSWRSSHVANSGAMWQFGMPCGKSASHAANHAALGQFGVPCGKSSSYAAYPEAM